MLELLLIIMDLSASSSESNISGDEGYFFDAIASRMGANAYQYNEPKGSGSESIIIMT